MTDAELHRLKDLCAAATPGPWESDGDPDCDGGGIYAPDVGRFVMVLSDRNDAVFIAAAREAVPKLIAEVERLRLTEEYFRWKAAQKADDSP